MRKTREEEEEKLERHEHEEENRKEEYCLMKWKMFLSLNVLLFELYFKLSKSHCFSRKQ